MKFLSKYSDQAYSLLRIVSGFMFAFHGVQKMFGAFGRSIPDIFSQIWFGGLIELVCGFLIMIGFQTRWAAFLSSGTMAVAYFQFHWKFQLGEKLFPTMNRGELALLYSFVFLFIATFGPGLWSMDKVKSRFHNS